tara:strand:- start:99 stop:257 length:159 start_codon:yes stop_codon:yes gene_type:complete
MLKTNERWRGGRKGRREEKLKERREKEKEERYKNEHSRCKTNYNTCCVPPVA